MSQVGNPAVEPAPVAAQTPVQPVVAAPAVVAPVTVTPTPEPVIAPVEAPVAPVVETVLGEALAKEPVKTEPTEVKTEQPIKEEGQSDEPAPPPTYEPFTLPENFTLEEERVKEFTSILGEFEGKTKADHAAVQEFGQKAVNFHVAEIQRTVDSMTKSMEQEWENTKKGWKESFMSDPELGGNRWQTSIDSALNFIRTHGGTEEQQAQFRELMNTSGIGNHPAMIRLLANAGSKMSEGKPLMAVSPVTAPKSRTATMYGGSSNN